MDHLHLCRLLGWCVRTAVRLFQQIYPPDFAWDHELGRSLARRDCRRLGNAWRSGGRRCARVAIEELRVRLYRAMEHAAGSGFPVNRFGHANRNCPRPEQIDNGTARGITMTPRTPDHALEIIDLKKAFGGLVVTQDISLAIRQGERRLIIGPNGAGKTTLFNQISGDMRANSGQIRLFGEDITQFSPYKRAHLGLSRTYQIITLFTGDTLEHNVTLGLLGLRPSRWQMWRPLSFYGDLATEARRTLDAVGLLHLAEHPVSDIAYGEKRRVELAMALAQKPRVLLLDEPLVGRNGAGKTTCISTIIGFLKPRGGEIRLFGEPIEGLSPERISRLGIGLVPQGRRIFPSLTVRENLVVAQQRESMTGKPWNVERIYTMFPRLRERHAQFAGTLSGGELQMLAIGRALMGNPRVLLLDEPSEGLAPLIVAEVARTVRRLKEEGQSIVLVEQNLRFALDVADRAVILNTGRCVFAGDARDILNNEELIAQNLGVFHAH